MKNFVIQAKINEGDKEALKTEKLESKADGPLIENSESFKEEIIDECLEKVIQYLETKNKI